MPTERLAASLTSSALARPCRPRLADLTVLVSVRMSVAATLAAVPYSLRTARAVAECLSENSPASSGKILSATEVRRFFSAVVAVAGELLEPHGAFRRHARGPQAPEARVLGDEERVDLVGLGLAQRVGLAERVGERGVHDRDLVAVRDQELPQRHPVVAGGLHDDQALLRLRPELAEPLQQRRETLLVVGECERPAVPLAALAAGPERVPVLRDVYSEVLLQGRPFRPWPSGEGSPSGPATRSLVGYAALEPSSLIRVQSRAGGASLTYRTFSQEAPCALRPLRVLYPIFVSTGKERGHCV